MHFFSREISGRLLFACIAMWCCIPAGAQQVLKKGAEGSLQWETMADTATVMRLIRTGEAIRDTMPDSAGRLFYKALTDSRESGFSDGAGWATLRLGALYAEQGKYEEGIRLFRDLLAGGTPVFQDSALLSRVYTEASLVFGNTGDFRNTAYHLYRALEEVARNNLGEPEHLVTIYGNLASLFGQMGQYEESLAYLGQGERIARKRGYDRKLVHILNVRGAAQGMMGRYDEAQLSFEAGYRIAAAEGMKGQQALLMNSLGRVFLYKNDPEQAMACFLKAEQLGRDSRIRGIRISAYYPLGYTSFLLGDNKNAIRYLEYFLAESETIGMPVDVANGHRTLADIYAKTGAYEKAFLHERRYNKIRDSLINKENVQAVRLLEVRYHTAEKDRALARSALLLTRQEAQLKMKNFWIASIAGGALLLTAFMISLYRSYRSRQYLQTEQMRTWQQEQEISQLKAIMKGEEQERARIARELHDGIGGMLVSASLTLGAVKEEHPELAHIRKIGDLKGILHDIASEVRKTAHNLMPDVLIRHSLEDALGIYCDNINAGSQLEIELQFQGDFDGLDKSVELLLYRITQELVQNVVKHARATYAAILIRQDGEKLSITVEDNGVGFDTDREYDGIGLQNLRYRVQALKGEISIMSAPGRNTTVYIEFERERLSGS
jgi:signal transduction histidine kinase